MRKRFYARKSFSLRQIPWKKIGLFVPSFFLLFVLESGFFSNLSFMTVPALDVGLITAFCFFEKPMFILFTAVIVGYFSDAMNSSVLTLRPIVYLVIALILLILARHLLPRFQSFLLLMMPASFLSALGSFFCSVLTYRSLPSAHTILSVFLPEMLWTFLFSLPLYWLAKGIERLSVTRQSPYSVTW